MPLHKHISSISRIVFSFVCLSITAATAVKAQYLYLGDYASNHVVRFDAYTGAAVTPNPFISTAGLAEGIDCKGSKLAVANFGSGKINLYDKATGAFSSTLVSNVFAGQISYNKSGSLIYAADTASGIRAFDSSTGAQVYSVSLAGAHDVVVGADGSVYAANIGNTVFKYSANLSTMTTFIAAGDHGLQKAVGPTFANDGSFYITNTTVHGGTSDFINHYDANGNFISKLTDASLSGAYGTAIGPDGNLYVANLSGACVVRFNSKSDTFIGAFVLAHAGGINNPKYIHFDSQNIQAVPEPGSIAMFAGLGIAGAGCIMRRRAHKKTTFENRVKTS